MSKVHALRGARVAYLCGPNHMINGLRPLTPPWMVRLPVQVAAVKALGDRLYCAKRYRQTYDLRDQLARNRRDVCDVDVVPGVANFRLCHLPHDDPDARAVAQACRERDLFIRDVSRMGRRLIDRAIRIAVKDKPANDHIVDILSTVLNDGHVQ